MANIIDAILRLTDNFTPTLQRASDGLTQYSRQAQRVGKDLQKIGDNIAGVGKTLTTAITAPIVGAGVASLKLGMDFEQSMSKVQALSMSSAEDMEKLNALAIKLGADTSMASSDVADAMQYMALAGWKAQDMIEGTAGIISLATASGEDLAEVCDIVTDAISAFGLKADSSSRFADVLASTVTNSNTTVSMMGEAFTYVSSVAGAFNYTIEDTALAIGLMANSGIKASQAGTALRKIMTETNGAFEVVGDNLGKYVIQTTKADGSMVSFKETMIEMRKAFSQLTDAEKAANAEDIAGKTGMAGLLAIINASEADFNKLASAIDNSKDSAEEMSKIMLDNLWGQIELISGSIESMALRISQNLTPYARKLADVIQSLTDKMDAMSDEQVTNMMKMAGMIASIPPLILLYGKLVKGVGKAMVSFGKFGSAVRRAGSVFKVIFSPANSIVLIMTAVALVAILVIKNWDKIKPVLDKVYSFMKEIWNAMGIDLGVLKEAFSTAKQHIITAFTLVKQFLSDHSEEISAILEFLKNTFVVIFAAIGGYLAGWIGNVINIVQHVMDAFNSLCDFIGHALRGEWEKAWQSLWDVVKNIFGAIVEYVFGKIEAIFGAVKGVVNAIKNIGKSKVEVETTTDAISPIVKNTVAAPTISATTALSKTIPAFAKGTDYFEGGLAQVHEKGGEIIDLPRGSRVYPHDESIKKAFNDGAKSSGGFSIEKLADTIIVREDADIDKIANALYNKFKKHALNMA